jgi:hypothetical protein
MGRIEKTEDSLLDSAVRRLLGTDASVRYLRALPAFQVDPRLPPVFREMLEEIEAAERKQAHRSPLH